MLPTSHSPNPLNPVTAAIFGGLKQIGYSKGPFITFVVQCEYNVIMKRLMLELSDLLSPLR
jgi:hypothetical protein